MASIVEQEMASIVEQERVGSRPRVDRRGEAEFVERMARGLKNAAELLARAGVPRPAAQAAARPASGAGPAWDLERLASSIASSVASFLGVPDADADADFFDLGGTSAGAVELVARLAGELGVHLTLDDLFADARPRRLAARWLERTGAIGALAAAGSMPAVAGGAAPFGPALAGPTALQREPREADADLRAIQGDLDLANGLPWVAGPVREPPRRILLTGATGFLGSHLLFDLLRHSDAHVLCLVRARDERHGEARLAKALASFALPWSSEVARRITIVPGDIQEPSLGWDRDRWDLLAAEVDSVVNVAAAVDFLRGYRSLRRSNVLGPLTLAAFAATGRIKPLHHISSIAVFNEVGIQSMAEDDPVAHLDRLSAGYDKSKWAAEAALRRAREHGLLVTFHRPGGIGGHTRTGAYNPKDLNSGFMAAWMSLRAMPAFRYLNVAPVDWVSRVIAAIVCEPAAWGYNFNLAGQPLALHEVVRDMALGGLNMRVHSFEEWKRCFLARMEAEPVPHLEYVARVLQNEAALKLCEATLTGPAAVGERTAAFVRRHNLPPPPRFDARAQVKTFERLARDGRVRLPDRADPPYLEFRETIEGTLGPAGGVADSPCTFKLTASIASFHQLLKERRVDIHGEVSCPLLDAAPLRVESGSFWVRPDDGVPRRHGLVHPLLRYRLELQAADGQRWWIEGTKTAEPGLDLFRQARTLAVEAGRHGEPATLGGELVVPAASYLPEQIHGLRASPSLPPREQRLAKLLWLGWFGAQAGLGFLDPMLRVAAELLDLRKGGSR